MAAHNPARFDRGHQPESDTLRFPSHQWNNMPANTRSDNDTFDSLKPQVMVHNNALRTKRSRSGTLDSMTSIQSYASGFLASGSSSRRASYVDGISKSASQSSLMDATSSKLKPLFARGTRPGRSNSRPLTAGTQAPVNAGQFRSLLRKVTSPKEREVVDIRPFISSPFDFQHISHTGREDVRKSAAQPPSTVAANTTRASPCHSPQLQSDCNDTDDVFRGFSSTSAHADADNAEVVGDLPAPSSRRISKPLPMEPASPPPPPKETRRIRHIRSVESFSRPRPKSRSPNRSRVISPPPRTSSRTAFTLSDSFETTEEEAETANASNEVTRDRLSKRSSGLPAMSSSTPITSPSLAAEPAVSVTQEEGEEAMAVTTNGEMALPALSSPALSVVDVLECVDEEPENHFAQQWSSKYLRSSQMMSPLLAPPMFLETLPSGRSRPVSGLSDTLGSDSSSPSLRRASSSPRLSFTPADGDDETGELDAWDDIIDYCYEHEAEARCDFDWRRPSFENRRLGQQFQGRPTLTVPDIHSVPDFGPRSAQSTLTGSSILTPNDNGQFPPLNRGSFAPSYTAESEYTDSPISPKRSGMHDVYGDMYEQYDSLDDSQFPVFDSMHCSTISNRSSNTRHSKRSSYDSSVMTGHNSVTSSFRRSASSSSSLPDLVYSRASKSAVDISVESLMIQETTTIVPASTGSSSEGTPTNEPTSMHHKSMSEFSFFEDPVDSDASTPTPEPVQSSDPRPLPSVHERSASDSTAKLFASATAQPAADTKTTRQRSASSAVVGHLRHRSRSGRMTLFPAAKEPMPPPPVSPSTMATFAQ